MWQRPWVAAGFDAVSRYGSSCTTVRFLRILRGVLVNLGESWWTRKVVTTPGVGEKGLVTATQRMSATISVPKCEKTPKTVGISLAEGSGIFQRCLNFTVVNLSSHPDDPSRQNPHEVLSAVTSAATSEVQQKLHDRLRSHLRKRIKNYRKWCFWWDYLANLANSAFFWWDLAFRTSQLPPKMPRIVHFS